MRASGKEGKSWVPTQPCLPLLVSVLMMGRSGGSALDKVQLIKRGEGESRALTALPHTTSLMLDECGGSTCYWTSLTPQIRINGMLTSPSLHCLVQCHWSWEEVEAHLAAVPHRHYPDRWIGCSPLASERQGRRLATLLASETSGIGVKFFHWCLSGVCTQYCQKGLPFLDYPFPGPLVRGIDFLELCVCDCKWFCVGGYVVLCQGHLGGNNKTEGIHSNPKGINYSVFSFLPFRVSFACLLCYIQGVLM